MSIKRYGTRHDWIEGGVIGIGPDDNGRYVLYTDHAAEVERLTAERDAAIKRCDALSQELKLTEEELDDVQGKLDEAEEFSSASLTLILRHVGEPEIEEDDFVSITDLEQSIMRHNAVSDAAVRERDAAGGGALRDLLSYPQDPACDERGLDAWREARNKARAVLSGDHISDATEMVGDPFAQSVKMVGGRERKITDVLRHVCKHLCQWKDACETGCIVSAALADMEQKS